MAAGMLNFRGKRFYLMAGGTIYIYTYVWYSPQEGLFEVAIESWPE